MGFSIQNLEEKTKGSVFSLTFYKANGIEIVRAKAPIVNNPKTNSQQLNRLNMLPLIMAYRQLKPLLLKSLNNRPENQFAYAKFLSLNLNHSLINGVFYFENFTISGSICDPDEFGFSILPGEVNNLFLSWDPVLNEDKFPEDLLCFTSYNTLSKQFYYNISNVFRSSGQFLTFLDLGSPGSTTILYLFFVRSNYSDSGKTFIAQINNEQSTIS